MAWAQWQRHTSSADGVEVWGPGQAAVQRPASWRAQRGLAPLGGSCRACGIHADDGPAGRGGGGKDGVRHHSSTGRQPGSLHHSRGAASHAAASHACSYDRGMLLHSRGGAPTLGAHGQSSCSTRHALHGLASYAFPKSLHCREHMPCPELPPTCRPQPGPPLTSSPRCVRSCIASQGPPPDARFRRAR